MDSQDKNDQKIRKKPTRKSEMNNQNWSEVKEFVSNIDSDQKQQLPTQTNITKNQKFLEVVMEEEISQIDVKEYDML